MTRKYPDTPEGRAAKLASLRASGKATGHRAHPTRSIKRIGRSADRITDQTVEDFWFPLARRDGAIDDTMTRDQQRRTVKRYADSQILDLALSVEPGTPAPLDDDDAAKEKWHRFEIERLHRVLEVDLRHAREHQRQADGHELALGELLADREFGR